MTSQYHIATINANQTFIATLQAESTTHYNWQHWADCQPSLTSLSNTRPTLWILCMDNDSPELLDFIPPLYQQHTPPIVVIDNRTIHMPSLWIAYVKAGAVSCLVNPNVEDISTCLALSINQHGVLHLPNMPQTILCRYTPCQPIESIDQHLIEMCLDAELADNPDGILIEHLNAIEEYLLNRFQTQSLTALLPDLLQVIWHQQEAVC